MRAAIRIDRNSLDPALRDLNTWPKVDSLLLAADDTESYGRREQAVRNYMCGWKVDDIVAEAGFSRQELKRLVRRCLERHSDGRIWGFRALIPRKRIHNYARTVHAKAHPPSRRGGDSGALTQLFEKYPDIKNVVDVLFLKRVRDGVVHESRITVKSIHKRFLTACRQHGLTSTDYPFTTKWLGISGLGRYLRRLFKRELAMAVRARHGREAARSLKANKGGQKSNPVTHPYQRVEFDPHRIDGFWVVLVPNAYGGIVPVVLERLWLLVIKESRSRAILGYHLSLNSECNQEDGLQCIKNAIVPWKPRELTIPGLRYEPDCGLPSGAIPELAWALWDEFLYDNALANLAEAVRGQLTEVVKCAVNAGNVDNPERRALIERFFHTLEENGFHRLPSTTGSDPDDPRRQNPEKLALRYGISLTHLEELVDVMIAQFNATPHAGIGYRTPLEMLRYDIGAGGSLVRTLTESERAKLALLSLRIVRTVRGDIKKGRRPYVELEGARYQNEVLSRSPDLIGKELTLWVDRDELRNVTAFLPDGSDLGALTAQGYWGRTPHTLEMRRAINRLRHRKLIFYTEHDDPVQVYLDYLARTASTNKRASAAYTKAKRVVKSAGQQMGLPDSPLPNTKGSKSPPPPSYDEADLLKQKTITY